MCDKISKQKQTSPLNYGFTKKISHRRKLVNVVLGNEGNKTNFVCSICEKYLKTLQALVRHMTWCKNKTEMNLASDKNSVITLNQIMNVKQG